MCVALFAVAASKLSKDLGYGMPISSVLSSVSFVVCLFFYLYVIGSFFKVSVYPLIDRVTDNIIFDIITLLSIPLIISVSFCYYYYYYYPRYLRQYNQQHQQQKNILLNFNTKLTLQYISLAV